MRSTHSVIHVFLHFLVQVQVLCLPSIVCTLLLSCSGRYHHTYSKVEGSCELLDPLCQMFWMFSSLSLPVLYGYTISWNLMIVCELNHNLTWTYICKLQFSHNRLVTVELQLFTGVLISCPSFLDEFCCCIGYGCFRNIICRVHRYITDSPSSYYYFALSFREQLNIFVWKLHQRENIVVILSIRFLNRNRL